MLKRIPFVRTLACAAFACAGVLNLPAAAAAPATKLTLPVAEVRLVADKATQTYPGRVVTVACVNVVPQVSGEILEVGFANGALVKEGDLLYRLDSVKYAAAVKNAEAKVAESRAAVSYAELSYARHQRLIETHAVSQDALDNSLSARDSARAALVAAEADLTVARDNLKHCRIVAPIAGRIGTTLFTRGNYVTPASGTLVTLVQESPIRVRFSISNRQFLELFDGRDDRIAAEAEVTLALADGSVFAEKGKVEYVDNAADDLTDTVQVFVLFPNAGCRLKTGGTVAVTLSSRQGVLRPAVPPTAVLQDTQGPYVWVVAGDGSVSRRTIARGETRDEWLFVEKGLKAGERVVADGAHKVRRDSTVEAVK